MSCKVLVLNPDHCMELPFEGELTVGREVTNTLSLQGTEISRKHAVIEEQGDQIIIRDLDSRNGVYVNGDRIKVQALKEGDEIVLGSTILIFNPAEGMDIEDALSSRGEQIFRRTAASPEAHHAEPITVFTHGQMNSIVQRLFSQPENTSYFQLSRVTALLKTFYDMDGAMNTVDLFEVSLKRTLEFVGGDYGLIVEADPNKDNLQIRAAVAQGGSEASIQIPKAIMQVVLKAERSVFCPNVAKDNRFSNIDRKKYRLHSFVGAPMISGGTYVGFLFLASQDKECEFNYASLRSLHFVASHLASYFRARRKPMSRTVAISQI
ncbi:FHA domain-containing protein [Candidatus Sumerlaeota bacterium]|nr:FHA domain-containing protein [Candidatus Sumerlaeota bacterium]